MRPKHQNKQKDILFVLISSFVVVVVWIGSNLYHIHVTSTVAPDIQKLLSPIDPTFDTQIIQKLKSRINVVPAFERQAIASPAAQTSTPTPTTPIPNTAAASGSASQSTPVTILGQ